MKQIYSKPVMDIKTFGSSIKTSNMPLVSGIDDGTGKFNDTALKSETGIVYKVNSHAETAIQIMQFNK